jgi:hypothetical protein
MADFYFERTQFGELWQRIKAGENIIFLGPRDVLINWHMARLRSPYLLKMGSASRQFSQPLAGRLTARKLTLKRPATLGKYVPKPFGSGFFGRSAAL